ncbi:mechanosensitive ion channel [Aerococcaceae bacterium DSM 111020]|nr:mechanosensitive ion channel [Aerococcaceae bacterium DSM 111020]
MSYEDYLAYLNTGIEDPAKFFQRILLSLVLIGVLLLMSRGLTWLLNNWIDDPKRLQITIGWKRLATLFISLGIIMKLWFTRMESLALVITIIGFVSVLALRGLILDIMAYLYISFREPFDIGDRIEIAGFKGDVLDIDFLQIHLLEVESIISTQQSTGRSLMIPNRKIFEEASHNYSYKSPFIKQDVSILIDFDNDRELAFREAARIAYEVHQEIIEHAEPDDVEAFEKSLAIGNTEKKPSVHILVKGIGFEITVTYFSDYHRLAYNNSRMQLALYDGFQAKNITMPTAQYMQLDMTDHIEIT